MERQYSFEVLAEARIYRTIRVVLPDGLTEEEVRERMQDAMDDYDWSEEVADDIETTVREMPDYTYAPPDLSPLPVPEECWFEWRGARWATEGNMLIREGSPPIARAKPDEEWFGPHHRYGAMTAEKCEAVVANIGKERSVDSLLHVRFVPLVSAAASVVEHGHLGPICLYSADGSLFAIVMPTRADGESEELKRLSTLRRA